MASTLAIEEKLSSLSLRRHLISSNMPRVSLENGEQVLHSNLSLDAVLEKLVMSVKTSVCRDLTTGLLRDETEKVRDLYFIDSTGALSYIPRKNTAFKE